MFRGQHQHSVDAKGRTSLPARFREQLASLGEARVVIARSLDPCLVAYPMQAWLEFEQRLAAMPSYDDAVERMRRHTVGSAEECDVDKLGRLVLPAHLRKYAAIDSELLWVGNIQYIELWDRVAYEQLDAPLTPVERSELKRKLSERELRA